MISFAKSETQNPIDRFLFFLYCIVGGVYFSKVKIDSRIKQGWRLLTASSLFILTIGGLFGYFLTTASLDISSIAHVLTFSNAILYCVLFVPAVSFYFRDELESVMSYISRKYSKENRFDTSNFGTKSKVNAKTIGLVIFLMQTAIALAYILINIVILFAFGNETFVKDVKNYLGPVPFVERINSRKTYLMVLIIQAVLETPPIIIAGAMASFTIMMGYGFYNASIDLFSHSKKMSEAMRSIESECESPNLSRIERELLRRSQKVALADVLKQVREHQEFVKMIKLFLPYLEIFSSVQFVAFFASQLPNVYIMLLTNPPVYVILRQVFYLSLSNVCLIATCYVGKLLDDVNEDFRNEIYSLPWYNMSLNYRKLVHIFLCQAHKPLNFYSFKINKVSLDSFVQAWKVMYSFVNILRVTLHPK